MSDHTPTPYDATGAIPNAARDARPSKDTPTHTPAWVCTAASPLAATLAAGDATRPVALWPTGQRSDAAQRAGRYAPDAPRHPARLMPDTAARIIAEYSQPGQKVLGLFCGSGTSVVEAVYAGRDAVGIDDDRRWIAVTHANLAYACDHDAQGSGSVRRADARFLPEALRRERGSVDLLIATPPARLTAIRPGVYPRTNDDIVFRLGRDLGAALFACQPLLRPGGTVVFVTRLMQRSGQLVDLTYPVRQAAESEGLELVERAAALRVPIRDGQLTRLRRPRRPTVRRRRRTGPPVVYDDVLVYHVPTRWQWWLRG
jgi:hypothetical protein